MALAQTQPAPKLVIRKIIHAKREQVFNAWTDPTLLEQWLKPPAQWRARTKADVRVGGRYHHEMIVGGEVGAPQKGSDCSDGAKAGDVLLHEGEYLELTPPEKLVFTWNSPSVKNTRVTVEFKDLGETTELWLTHELLPTEKDFAAHQSGWEACLENLSTLIAK